MSTTKGPPGIGHNSGAAEPETILDPLHETLRKIASDYAELKEPTAANKLDGHAADTLVPVANRPSTQRHQVRGEACIALATPRRWRCCVARAGLSSKPPALFSIRIPLGQPGVDWPAEEERQGDQAVARGLRQARPA